MNISLRQLRALIAVARTGSFTRAAQHLSLTQSALSGLIKELETTLGLRLFDRSTRQLQLSEGGRRLVPQIEQILHDLDAVLEEAQSLRSLKTGSICIAAPQLMAATFLPAVMARFSASHPGIQVRLRDCTVEALPSAVFSGEVDFGIGPERKGNAEIRADLLFDLPFMAVCPPGHALAAQASVSWPQLLSYPFIALQGEFSQRLSSELRQVFRARDQLASSEVSFMSTALSMVSAGLGVTTCMPYAAEMVQLHGLCLRPLCAPRVTRRFFIYRRKARSLSPAAQQFEQLLRAYLAEQPFAASPRPD